MSVAKIIEISCESPKSFEDAIQSGIARASKTIHNIKGAWVKEQQVIIENNKIRCIASMCNSCWPPDFGY
jgi:hypothetical protein